MTDIVERLRSPANVFYEYAADNGAFLREAADEIERLRATLDQTRRFALNGEMDTIVSDEIERLRERCTYFYEALHDIALGAHGNDGIEFARKAIGFVKLEFDADKIAAANNLINRAALGEKE